MNERIKLLADRAGYTPLPGFDFANDLQEVFLEKFAELIVRECLDIVEDEDTGDVYSKSVRLATIRIKKHFGVEE
jgi:hypothetical protein